MLSSTPQNDVFEFTGKEVDKDNLTPNMTAKNSGCTFFAIDSMKMYQFDGDTLTWVLLFDLSDDA